MNAGPAGFVGAPVSKVLVLSVLGSSVLVQATSAAGASQHRVVYLLSTAGRLLIFRHPGVLIFGTALLYYFRLFERQWGAVKYGSFSGIVLGLSIAGESLAVRLLRWSPIPGPYPLIFANFIPFFLDVPPTQRFTVLGINLSDKAFIYLAGVQLLVGSRGSFLGAACGLLAGLAYSSNLFGLQRLLVPKAVCRFLGGTVGRLFGARTLYQAPPPTLPNGPSMTPVRPAVQQANAPAMSQASPQAVQQLVAMGFQEAAATQALQLSNNDIQAALSHLL
ncbi:hypothetical protein WJX73_004441 [Symbiochloris irregularis]|uniref:UBA domain-containing protein n=1 Tax=Symbiochloris irregularis TaxID=706552 RepID=A0AAW1NV40_9CHLO